MGERIGLRDILSEKDYKARIQQLFPNEPDAPELTVSGKHFRTWILILNTISITDVDQLKRLRSLLNNDRKLYFEFAGSMQRFYSVLSVDVRAPILRMRYFKKNEIDKYIQVLSDDMKDVAKIFYKSEERH